MLNQTQVTDHYELGTRRSVDGPGPTGGSVDATGLVGTGARYSTSTTLSLAFAKGTDPSGVAATRATAAAGDRPTLARRRHLRHLRHLHPGLRRHDPTSPLADTVTDQACYSYQYVVVDTLGNATTYTSPDIKVDTTAPAAPTLRSRRSPTPGGPAPAAPSTTGPRPASGSFTATAAGTDSASGIASYSFPGARHQLDLDARRARGEHLLLVRRPGRAGHEERHRHQQRGV